jgi:nucleotide-binding universal stress UspA family protein
MTPQPPKIASSEIGRILCPSDLSTRSRRVIEMSAQIAATLGASLTACHCVPAKWFATENQLPDEQLDVIRRSLTDAFEPFRPKEERRWQAAVIQNSFDPAHDIVGLAKEIDAELIVMNARPGHWSAFRYGSLVERVVLDAHCPVLLFPAKFLDARAESRETPSFARILFDFDFSASPGPFFHVANTFAKKFSSELHMLSVFEPSAGGKIEFAQSRRMVKQAAIERMNDAAAAGSQDRSQVVAAIEWGRHAETVIRYSDHHSIDLIFTSLPRPHYYFEKLYSAYLGDLLAAARCPIMVMTANGRST